MNPIRRGRRGGGLIGLLLERIQFDWFASIALTALLTLLIVFSLVSGTAVWPVVLGGSGSSHVLEALFASVRLGGLVVILVDAAVAFAVMFLRRGTFSFLRGMMVNLLVGWIIFMFFTFGHREVISSLGTTGMTVMLWSCLSVVISYVLAVLPALVTAGLAKLAHGILDSLL